MTAKEKFVDNTCDVLGRIEVRLVRLSQEEFTGTAAYDLFGCVRHLKATGMAFSFDDLVNALMLMERVLLSMQSSAIGFDAEMVDCFIEFSNYVSELMGATFDDEAIMDE